MRKGIAKKIMTLVLAASMLLGSVSPAPAHAQGELSETLAPVVESYQGESSASDHDHDLKEEVLEPETKVDLEDEEPREQAVMQVSGLKKDVTIGAYHIDPEDSRDNELVDMLSALFDESFYSAVEISATTDVENENPIAGIPESDAKRARVSVTMEDEELAKKLFNEEDKAKTKLYHVIGEEYADTELERLTKTGETEPVNNMFRKTIKVQDEDGRLVEKVVFVEELEYELKEGDNGSFIFTFLTGSFSPFIFADEIDKESEEWDVVYYAASDMTTADLSEETVTETPEEGQDEVQQEEAKEEALETPEENKEEEAVQPSENEEGVKPEEAEKEEEKNEPEVTPVEEEAEKHEEGAEVDLNTPITPMDFAGDAEFVNTPENKDEELLQTPALMMGTRSLLKAGLKSSSTPEMPTPVTGDGVTIEQLSVKWKVTLPGELKESNWYDTLEVVPFDENIQAIKFQIDYAFSGKDMIAAGDIEIVIPAYIWKTKTGREAGFLNISAKEFEWKRVGENIVFTNARPMSAATSGYIQGVWFHTSPNYDATPNTFTSTWAYEMWDVDNTNPQGRYENGMSDDFYAVVNLVTPKNQETLTMTSNSIRASMNTSATLAAVSKTAMDSNAKKYMIYLDHTKAGIPEELLPAEPEKYVFIKWYADARAIASQSFTMTMKDTVADNIIKVVGDTRTELNVNGVMLGASDVPDLGVVKSRDGKNVEFTLFKGWSTTDKSCYIWTAYDKDELGSEEDMFFEVPNSQTTTLVGDDDKIATELTASNTVSLRLPIVWKIDKVWDDDNNRRGLRPETTPVWMDNLTTNTRRIFSDTLSDANNWHTEYEDNGSVSRYEAFEYTYDVSRIARTHPIISGYTDWEERDDGSRVRLHWWYAREKTEYDEETHTWTFTNKYYEAYDYGIISVLALSKVSLNHTNDLKRATSDKDLNLLRDGQETTEITYHVSTSTMTLGHTTELGKLPSDETALGKYYVKLVLHDTRNSFEARYLDPDEFYIKRVHLEDPVMYSWAPSPNGSVYHAGVGVGDWISEDPIPVTLEGYKDGAWKEYAIINKGEVSAKNGATAQGVDVFLPIGVTQVRTSLRTNLARASMGYTLGIIIKPTDAIRNRVEELFESDDYIMARNNNHVESTLYTDSDEVIMSLERWDAAHMHGRNMRLAVDLDKSVTNGPVDAENERLSYENKIVLTQQSNIENMDEYEAAIRDGVLPKSASGTFWDLLPAGMTADEDTFRLNKGTIKKITITDNYLGSGRQLIKVDVDLDDTLITRTSLSQDDKKNDGTYPNAIQGQALYGAKATLTFTSWYTFEEAFNRGTKGLKNYAVYAADEEAFGNIDRWMGEAGAPTGDNHKESVSAAQGAEELLAGLDPTRTGNVFVYAGADVPERIFVNSGLTSLHKYVKVAGSTDDWKSGIDNDVNVFEGGKYSYAIVLTSASETTTKDIIILDSIENYAPIRITSPGTSGYEVGKILSKREFDYMNESISAQGGTPAQGEAEWAWNGTVESIDVSEIRAMGVDTKLYYAFEDVDVSVANMNPGHEMGVVARKLENSSVWHDTIPAGKTVADVKAIAVDCRYADRTAGIEYELPELQSLIIYVNMKAPTFETAPEAFSEEDYQDFTNNARAYNNVFMDVTQTDDHGGTPHHSYDHYDYTKVGIYGADIDVTKVWDDEDNNDAMRPEEVTVRLYRDGEDTGRSLTIKAEDDWKARFEHVLLYDEDGVPHTYTLKEESVPGYTSRSVVIGTDGTVTNKHDPELVSIPFRKVWTSDEPEGWQENIPASITVRLYKDGEYYGVSKTVREGENGVWAGVFEGLRKYDKGREIVYTVDEEEVPKDFFKELSNDGEEKVITNTYFPYGDLEVTKEVVNATPLALDKEFTFTLTLRDKDGAAVVSKYAYEIMDAEGSVIKTGRIGNGGEFTLKRDEKIHIFELPTRVEYSIKESPVPGFSLSSSSGANGTIAAEKVSSALFVNTYRSTGSAPLRATKTLEGRELTRYQFRFEVKNEDGEVIRTASNLVDGSVSFGQFNFSDGDNGKEFTYTVSEIDRERPGYVYDDKVVTVKFTPVDNGDGTMTVGVKYFDEEGAEIDVIEFANSYVAEGDLEFKAYKFLKGRALEDGEFSFVLEDEEGNIVASATNDADGNIVFPLIHFTQDDIGKAYDYIVRELKGDDETVNYSSERYLYHVEVMDNGDGTLGFTHDIHSINDEELAVPVFTNTLKDGNLSVSKTVTNPDVADASQVFRFKIQFTGMDSDKSFSWEKTEYKKPYVELTYDGRGGYFNDDPTQTENILTYRRQTDDSFVLDDGEVLEPNYNGYEFEGWYEDEEYIFPWDTTKTIEYDKTVYAKWKQLEDHAYAVFDSADGSLTFFRDDAGKYSDGETIGTKTYWNEIETKTSRSWGGKNTQILSVSVEDPITPVSCYEWFSRCYYLTSIDLSLLDTSNVTYMSYMFADCSALTSLDLSGFDTGNVEGMSEMFRGCSGLTSLDVSGFDTGNVTDMSYMFYNCTNLAELDVSGWDTGNVTDMRYMFGSCSGLTSLDVSGFDTGNVTNMSGMFYYCRRLENIYASELWNVGGVISSLTMFGECSNLPNYGSSYTTDISKAYYGGDGLGYLTYKAAP